MSDNLSVRDPGLQPERTALAWQRTAFAVLVFSMAAVRIAFARADTASCVLAVAGLILALAVVGLSWSRQQSTPVGAESAPGKGLLSAALCLVAVSQVLPAIVALIHKGHF